MTDINRFRGNGLPSGGNEDNVFPYLADKGLVTAVNLAVTLERPLLVKGPPGCGKTRLARAVAHELGLELYEWYIKSTSRARDGIYTIDMVRRLQDAQLRKDKAQKLTPYIRFGPLGKALKSPTESVVLIDEIDKADIDFPNDLLQELDEKRFTIEELDESEITGDDDIQKTYAAVKSPIIIITSNDEKELPDAFLRRCLFYYIKFPEPELLTKIVEANTKKLNLSQKLVENAIGRLNEFRKIEDLRKSPATSELIHWVRILHYWQIKPEKVTEDKPLTDLPFWQTLFKHERDLQRVERTTQE